MSITSTYGEDEQGKIEQQRFQTLQAKVVDLRNAVILQRASAVIALRRYKQTKAQLKMDEAELTRIHSALYPDE